MPALVRSSLACVLAALAQFTDALMRPRWRERAAIAASISRPRARPAAARRRSARRWCRRRRSCYAHAAPRAAAREVDAAAAFTSATRADCVAAVGGERAVDCARTGDTQTQQPAAVAA